jgi:hypothetical protein
VRRSWLQKHDSPAAENGEFHWYPQDGDRELRARLAARLSAIEPNAAYVELELGRVVWARSFAAIAPRDGRSYVGVDVLCHERAATPWWELLAALALSEAGPCSRAGAPLTARSSPSGRGEPRIDDEREAARLLLDGGSGRVEAPGDAAWPRWLARLGDTLGAGSSAHTFTLVTGSSAVAPHVAAKLLVDARRNPRTLAGRAWRVARELAAHGGAVDEVLARAQTANPTHALGRRINAWGRGRLAMSSDQVADDVALCALGHMLAGGDAHEVFEEARWYALLPHDRRTALFTALARRASALEWVDG